MNSFDDTLFRVIARQAGRAVPTRNSRSFLPDPAVTIGIATIKIVTEEQIQAIAFGDPNGEPSTLVRLDPIGRDVTDLLPFADFLVQTADRVIAAEGELRVWVPNSATLEAIDVLGHRYWRNQTAPERIVRMGEICRVIAHETNFAGQQVIADATKLLRNHVVTGLSPVEEGHLGALLAWFDPTVLDPVVEARERIRLPASGILPNTPDFPIDDRVDRLRREAKKATGQRRRILESEIERILRHWVRREWDLLAEARRALLDMDLTPGDMAELVKDSRQRMNYSLANGHFPARRPDRVAKILSEMEASIEKANQADLESDRVLRDRAGRAGAVVRGTIVAVRQPRRNFKPCAIDVDSDQGVIRFRLDEKVKLAGTSVRGVVRALRANPAGGTRISLEIENGVRQSRILRVGSPVELLRSSYGFVNYRALNLSSQRQPWAFYSETVPTLKEDASARRSPLRVAAEARHR